MARRGPGSHIFLNGLELGYYKFSRNYLGDARAEVAQIYPVDVSQNPGEPCFVSVYLVADLEGGVSGSYGTRLRKNVESEEGRKE